MSDKFKLLASVAIPIISVPLLVQPAASMPLGTAVETGMMPGVIKVQQQIIPPVPGGEAASPEGERERPRRQQNREEGGNRPQREQAPAQAEQPRREAPERPAAEAPARERPQREAAPAQAEQPQREQPRRQQAEESQGGERERPRRPQAEQAPAATDSERPRRREAEQQGQGETPRQQERQNARERTAPAGSPAEAPAERPRANDRAASPDTTAPAAGATDIQRNSREQTAPATTREQQGERPRRNATETPTPQVQPDRARRQSEQSPAASQDATTPAPQPGQGQANQTRPTSGQTAPQTGAQPQAVQPPAAAGAATQQSSQPPVAQTPEQVDRARQIARDPASARNGEQVVLPVENGAAVLDSAKEQPAAGSAREGERPRRPMPQQAEQLAPPKSDAEAQAGTRVTREQQEALRALSDQRGERLDRRPEFERPRGWDVTDLPRGRDRDRDNGRIIISIDNQTFVRHDDSRRFYDERGRAPEYERLRDGRVREVIVREDGTRIVTIRNRYGEIVQRSRIVRGGEEYVLYYAPELVNERRGPDYVWRDPGYDLPPMRLTVPLENYIIDTSSEPDRDYYEFLEQPPVERVERVYTLDEVRYSARIRDKVPRIDLDTITFATGSAEIPMNQASSLRRVAEAINKILDDDPAETFLIEGHTDAVGDDQSNLVLSDERAESVARVLTDAFGIPPENLTTQGYGERYLKVRTEAANQENRRVTIRRITPLVKPVASNR